MQSFLAYRPFVKVIQVFKSFLTVYSMTIFGVYFLNSIDTWTRNLSFWFVMVSEAACTIDTCIFPLPDTQRQKLGITQMGSINFEK